MKCRLFSVSLSVSMAMPPMPAFSSSDVSVELNVSANETREHTEDPSQTFLKITRGLIGIHRVCCCCRALHLKDEASSSNVQTYRQTAPCV